MQDINKYRVFTLKTAIQDMPKWKFLNFSKALLLLSWYYNNTPQYNITNTSASPPRDYSCKGKAEASFLSLNAIFAQDSSWNSCKEKAGKTHTDLSVFSHHLVTLYTSAHFLQIRDFTKFGKYRIYRVFERF